MPARRVRSIAEAEAELARCEREQREMIARAETHPAPAWLVTLGIEDWEMEKRLILAEAAMIEQAPIPAH